MNNTTIKEGNRKNKRKIVSTLTGFIDIVSHLAIITTIVVAHFLFATLKTTYLYLAAEILMYPFFNNLATKRQPCEYFLYRDWAKRNGYLIK